MKAALLIIVIVFALSQTAFCRPDSSVARSNSQNCVDDLFANLERHVAELGDWFELWLLEATVRRELIDYSRGLCDKFLISNPPSVIEQYFFDGCISENDKALENESLRIRCELERKVAEQPELLSGYFVEFTRCLLPWTSRSANISSDCDSFRRLL